MRNAYLLLMGFALLGSSAFGRTWTSTDGRTIEADFVKLADKSVVVRRGGKSITIPLDKLSKADREWAAKEAAKPVLGEKSEADTKRITGILESMLKAKVSDAEREEVAAFFSKLLPTKGADGEDIEWVVGAPSAGDGKPREQILISADLHPKGDKETRLMWFHIIFRMKADKVQSPRKFGRYPVLRLENAHCFVTAKRTDVRGVASADSYRNDEKIDAIMKGIDLETISKL